MTEMERITKRLDIMTSVMALGFFVWALDHGHDVLAYAMASVTTLQSVVLILKERR